MSHFIYIIWNDKNQKYFLGDPKPNKSERKAHLTCLNCLINEDHQNTQNLRLYLKRLKTPKFQSQLFQ